MKVFCDTSVLVASALQAHEHYSRAVAAVRAVQQGKDRGFIAAHSLLETYAVLTRLPVSPRIHPPMAKCIIDDNFAANFEVIGLEPKEYSELITRLAAKGIVGGTAYDLLLLACAAKAEVDCILTFNVRHFRMIADDMQDKIAAP